MCCIAMVLTIITSPALMESRFVLYKKVDRADFRTIPLINVKWTKMNYIREPPFQYSPEFFSVVFQILPA